jgi:hypothetical protein
VFVYLNRYLFLLEKERGHNEKENENFFNSIGNITFLSEQMSQITVISRLIQSQD